ncbi:MAG: hypothetical protein LCH56_05245 [Proteobacteria bacterium]|nr:hypothetical protein [Pseudomonadota bacterium]
MISASKTVILALGLGLGVLARPAAAQSVICDMSGYKPVDGLAATADANGLLVTWAADAGQTARLQIAVQNGAPLIQDLSLRAGDGAWTQVVSGATPDFAVVSGLRRMSMQQTAPLKDLKIPLTKEVIDRYRWDPFWDAPLDLREPDKMGGYAGSIPPKEGIPAAGQPGFPRSPSEIQRASVSYKISGCSVRTEGARIVVDYPGVELGVFSGLLRYTIFRGTNMIRQEVIGKTTKEWVAYKYDAGLKGLAIGDTSRVAWRDTANTWQEYKLRGAVNQSSVPLRAANRLVAAQQGGGSISAFPPPHRFFWSREVATNVGYNYYRKDSPTSYGIGIRQNEHEDYNFELFQANWSLYSARPGTEQLITVFLYPAIGKAEDAVDKSLAFTNGDRYRALPGYQVMNHHYHMDMAQRLQKEGSPDVKLQDFVAMKAMGLNIISPIDSVQVTLFNESGDPMPDANSAENVKKRQESNGKRLALHKMLVDGARQHSDDSFLILANEEVFRGPLGGHTDILFSKPTYWDERLPGQAAEEDIKGYGKVYHIGSADDLMTMVTKENAIISMPHPRSKGSTGFPDAVKDRAYFNHPNYIGFGARWGMGLDGSERRLCEYRCWPLLDDLSNWMADKDIPLKRVISISEVYGQSPGDDIYGSAPVTYVRLAKLPPPEDVSPLIEAIKTGYIFWTSGEVLVPNFELQGKGRQSKIVADVSWTFPLEFVEVVWGDGKTTGRQIVPATDLGAFGTHHFEIPFDARGKKWVRFAAWDAASNGAVVQPVRIPR